VQILSSDLNGVDPLTPEFAFDFSLASGKKGMMLGNGSDLSFLRVLSLNTSFLRWALRGVARLGLLLKVSWEISRGRGEAPHGD
jgi:hypothetical protein